jgi:DNA polymerase delta subunit 3
LQILSDAARDTLETYSSEDPLKVAKTYGTVINTGVRRRTGQRPLPTSASIVTANPANQPNSKLKKADMDDSSNASNFDRLSSKVKLEVSSSQSTKDVQSKRPEEQKKAASTPSQLRRDSSNIFKSFAKAKPKLKREGTDSSAGTSGIDSGAPSGREDESMKGVSEDEEDDYVPPPQVSSKEVVETDRKSRKEREAALRKMMEDDDPEEDSLIETENTDGDFLPTDVVVSQPLKEAVQSVGGRRRGRKRVMKKRTIKDEEGYLGKLQEFSYIISYALMTC